MSYRNKVIYVSAKYTEETKELRQQNIDLALGLAAKVWDMGATAICANGNTAHLDDLVKNTRYDDFITGDLYLIDRSDALLMADNWERSKGATIERNYAIRMQKPVFHSLEELKLWLEGGNERGLFDQVRNEGY